MPMIINTNIASLNSQRNLNTSQEALSTALQRLSSGLRINSAKDDAAGMAIASRMTAQISGLNQASRNANDGISMAQTAEGALGQISDNLQRMRTLSVQAANGTNSASDRTAIQAEIAQLQSEINRVAQTTAFNGTNLLDGSLTNTQFQVGANANQTITASISSAQANAIGSNALTSNGTGTTVHVGAATNTFAATGTTVASQVLTIVGTGANATATATIAASTQSTVGTAAGSAYSIAAAVNAVSTTTGVTASASTTATLSTFTTTGAVTLVLYGNPTASGAANGVTVSATMATTTDVSGLTSAINAQSSTTGITAVANTTSGTITLTNSQGYDIGVKNQSSTVAVSLAGSTGAASALAANGATNSGVVGGQVSFTSSTAYTVASSVSTAGIFTSLATITNGSTLSSVAAIDVTTLTNGIPTGANNALSIIDGALGSINSLRAALGAMQNRFSSAVTNLQTTAENLTASRSRIQDADFAAETGALTRAQILQQAGTAMLAQANAVPNGVMTLLR